MPVELFPTPTQDPDPRLRETSPSFVCPIGFGEHLFPNVYSTYLGCITLMKSKVFQLHIVKFNKPQSDCAPMYLQTPLRLPEFFLIGPRNVY